MHLYHFPIAIVTPLWQHRTPLRRYPPTNIIILIYLWPWDISRHTPCSSTAWGPARPVFAFPFTLIIQHLNDPKVSMNYSKHFLYVTIDFPYCRDGIGFSVTKVKRKISPRVTLWVVWKVLRSVAYEGNLI